MSLRNYPIAVLLMAELLLGVGTNSAEAHSDLRAGAFSGGLLHPVQTPSQVLLLVGLGFWLGQWPVRLKRPLLILGTGIFLGLGIAQMGKLHEVPQILMFVLSLVLGVVIASGLELLSKYRFVVCGIVGLFCGLDSGCFGASALDTAKVLFGSWVSLLVGVGYLAFYSGLLPRQKWAAIGFRIVGSWIVAISFLMLALLLKTTFASK